MKINLTTTTIQPEKDDALTFEQLKSAPSGVYLCREHVRLFPSQRIVATKRGLTLFDVIGGNVTIQPVPAEYCSGCRFILAPEQVVNITFSKEEPSVISDRALKVPVMLSANATTDEYLAAQEASGIKPGDKVKVVRSVDSRARGWDNSWAYEMDSTIGLVFTVESLGEHGVYFVECDPQGGFSFGFPFFVLEKVS